MVDRSLTTLDRGLRLVLAALLAFITLGVFIQVCLRYLFNVAFLWGEELSLFAFIWCVFLGAALNVRRRAHFAMDILRDLLPARARPAQRLVVDLAILAFALVMLVEGWRFSVLSLQRLSPALGITLFVPTIVIPLSAVYMSVVALLALVRRGRDAGDRATG